MTATTASHPPETQSARRNASIASSAMTLFGGQLSIKVVSFLFSVIVIRHLGSEEYGKYAICVAFGGLFTVFSDLGLATLAVKRIARDRDETPRLFTNVFVLRLLLASGVVVATSVAAWLVGYDHEIRIGILIASLGLVSYALFGSIDAIAMGLERFRFSATLTVASQLLTLALAAVLIFWGAGFLGLLLAATLAVLVVSLVALFRLSRTTTLRAPVTPATWPGLTRAAAPFAATTLALAVSYRADALILSGFVGSSAIGEYAIAYALILTFVTLSHSINMALFPAMTRQQATDPTRTRELFQRGLHYLLLASLPVAIGVSLTADDLVTLLYGKDLVGAARPLAILAWVVPLMFLSEFLGYVAIVVDRERLVARANWAAAIANVGLNLVLIPIYGVMAAAVITVVTEGLLVAQFTYSLRHTGVLDDRWRTIGRTLVASAVLATVVLLLISMSLHVLLIAALAAGVYVAASLATGAIGREERAFVLALLRRG